MLKHAVLTDLVAVVLLVLFPGAALIVPLLWAEAILMAVNLSVHVLPLLFLIHLLGPLIWSGKH